jgi:hypothetical protein
VEGGLSIDDQQQRVIVTEGGGRPVKNSGKEYNSRGKQ